MATHPSPDPRFVEPLPAKPSLERQHKLAKQLLRALWQGEPEARERFAALHPDPPKYEAAKLSDAQLVIARGYGFASWAQLKRKIESLTQTPVEQFVAAVNAKDVARVRSLLEAHATVRAAVNDALFDFGGRAIHRVGENVALLDVLIEHGADPNGLSDWSPGGFTLLDSVPRAMVDACVARGATMTVHAAAKHDRLDDLRRLLDADPALVTQPGGDGQHPLHVAASLAVIDLLVERGAEVDARDVDHSATPAQYLAGRPELCRRLLEHGAEPDLFMAAMLGDVELAERCIARDPGSVSHRLGREPWVNDSGGHIYNWVIGHDVTPYQAARKQGHDSVAALSLAHCDAKARLLEAIWHGDEATAKGLIEQDAALLDTLTDDDRKMLPRAAWWYRPDAVRIMLDLGFDPHVAGAEDSTPLDRAAFHGYADIVALLLERDPAPPLTRLNKYGGTPLTCCLHGAMHGWTTGHPQDHAQTVARLIDAGSQFEASWLPTGHDDVDVVLRERLDTKKPTD